MLFFDRHIHPFTAVLASRILARLMFDQDMIYRDRLKEGFIVLSHLLANYGHVKQIYISLFAILFGSDVSLVSLDAPFDTATLLGLYKSNESKRRSFCPDVLLVIMAMMRTSMNALVEVNHRLQNKTSSIEALSAQPLPEGMSGKLG